jgi:phosphatidylserine/phosphatidylglycerophosphate/cardiolipin synthase-like enzyme
VARKSKALVCVLFFAALYSFLIKAALSPALPSSSNPIVLYSNQNRDDFRLVLKKSFASTSRSIHIWMYAATDTLLLDQLQKKASEGVHVALHFDRRGGTPTLPDDLHPHIVKSKGLMHRKIVILDDHTVFLGSANMTTSSLLLHDNLSVGIYDPQMAQFLKKPTAKTYSFDQGLLWLLPDPAALKTIEAKINSAQSSIFVAMFTLTQKDLIAALIRAKARGVDVQIAIDRYTARGASKKAVHQLSTAGIKILLSSGLPLLHHKWAYIDRTELILGSTNWTEAAFCKNDDTLLFLSLIPQRIQSQIESIQSAIQMESSEFLVP